MVVDGDLNGAVEESVADDAKPIAVTLFDRLVTHLLVVSDLNVETKR